MIKIIRTGVWASAYQGIESELTQTHHPVLIYNWAKPSNMLGTVFLGQFWGTWDAPKGERGKRVEACSKKGCVFPRKTGTTVCRAHWEWATAAVSHLRPQQIDRWDIVSRASDENPNPDPLFHTGWIGEDKYGFLRTYNDGFTGGRRSKAEIANDKWWKENVVDKGLEAPGVVVRKTSKELKVEMEAQIDGMLASYSQQQSAANIKAFWRNRSTFDEGDGYGEEVE